MSVASAFARSLSTAAMAIAADARMSFAWSFRHE